MLIAYISPKIKDIGRQALNLKVSICRENSSKRKRVLRKSGCGPDTIKFGIWNPDQNPVQKFILLMFYIFEVHALPIVVK